jgi:sterol desaturase/sphingolipid hydroxylase (fatty acid hydroxylase superfamily)
MDNKLFYAALTVFFIGGSLAEYWITREKDQKYYSLKDTWSSVKLMFSGFVVDGVLKLFIIYFMMKISQHSIFHFAYQWWSWLLCFVIWDFLFYLKHLAEHNIRFMWAIHINHHSSNFMNLSTAFRSGVFKAVYRYIFHLPVILLGFPISMFITIYGLGKLWAFFSHSRYLGKWGFLEKYVVTPDHHLLHHSRDESNYNKNFGETLLIWDKLFGTFKKNPGELEYGIHDHVDHANFQEVVMHELRNIRNDVKSTSNAWHKLMYIFGKPGWKPSTSLKTA